MLETFIFFVSIYILCKFAWNKLIVDKNVTKKEKTRYKYENLSNELNISDEKEKISSIDIDKAISEARNKIEEHKERIANYDFREFKGRKNVPWEDVYDYLWFQCRYKGIMMWNEYMNELINMGVINQSDKKCVFKKAGNYIPWNYRPDLEEEQNEFIKKTRKDTEYHDNFFEKSADHVYTPMYKDGLLTKEEYERYMGRNKPNHDDHFLKCFYYEEYLKRKGYI